MHAFVRRALFASVLLLPLVASAQAPPVFTVDTGPIAVEEGDHDSEVLVSVDWSVPEPLTAPVTVTIETVTEGDDDDFEAVAPHTNTFAVGRVGGSISVRLRGDRWPEPEARFAVRFSQLSGAVFEGGASAVDAEIVVVDDDVPPAPPVAWDDHILMEENGGNDGSGTKLIDPVGNDEIDTYFRANGSLVLTSQPQHGTITANEGSDGYTYYSYAVDDDFSGLDEFGYRVCDGFGGCDEARIVVEVRPVSNVSMNWTGKTGRWTVQFPNLRELTSASYLPTPLVRAQKMPIAIDVDPTPGDAWDSLDGFTWETITVPGTGDGEPVEHRIEVRMSTPGGPEGILHLGVDEDGDGTPDQAEDRCTHAPVDGRRSICRLSLTAGAEPVTYWIGARSIYSPIEDSELTIFDVAMTDGDGSLVVTGPAKAERKAIVATSFAWRDDAWVAGDFLMGYVRIADEGEVFGDFPVYFSPDVYDVPALRLTPGTARTIELKGGETYDPIFFDLPAGATSLAVSSASSADFDFYLARQTTAIDPAVSRVGPAPPREQAVMSVEGAGGNHDVYVPAGALAPGRWYVVPKNMGDARAAVTLQVDIAAVPPIVRPGSYFNAGRPGSGLLLYPAGDQWAGLWYTYEAFGRPTWYYLQAAAPDADGIWRSPIYRDIRHGDTSVHHVVGEAVVTPVGPDRFTLSYTVDGETGSEPYAALGRGCPTQGGPPIDISSHWFDPATNGTGYSVQTWESGYQFFARFDFDPQGMPVFLAAERDTWGGADAELVLERLEGACPTCDYVTPTRQPAGFLSRTVVGGSLESIRVDIDYVDQWPLASRVTWSADDTVQLLGGAGTTQGCE